MFRNSQKSFGAKSGKQRWVIHFGNRFLGRKLLDREGLVSWSIVMEKNQISGAAVQAFFNAQPS
jgi:hypothetical protein